MTRCRLSMTVIPVAPSRPSRENAALHICHAGWQLSNTRWVLQLGWSTYRSNLGMPPRSAHGPNRFACRYTSQGYLRQSERTA
jgi:hypothetical protein